MDTNITTAVWSRDTDAAWVSLPTVRRLAAACALQRTNTDEGGAAGALDVSAALLAGVLAGVAPRPRPESRYEVPGPVLSLLLAQGGPVAEAAEDALAEAGW